jgi:hypothetical protein
MWNDIKNYFFWRKRIRKNKNILFKNYNCKIDNADRLYLVINIPTDLIDENYSLKKSDRDLFINSFITNKLSQLSNYLNSIGLIELYDIYEGPIRLEKNSFGFFIGYKLIETTSIAKFKFFFLYPFLAISIILAIIKFLF